MKLSVPCGLAGHTLGRGHDEEARQAYRQLEAVSAYGASAAAVGLGDLAL